MKPLKPFLAAGFFALALSHAAGAASQVVTQPEWLAKPTAATVENAYPPIALQMAMSGRATIHCQVDEVGKLADCKVTSELPEGLGFGAAALAMAPAFQMRPRTVGGQAVAGVLNVPIAFRAPPVDPPAPAPAPSSAEALAIARQLVTAIAPTLGADQQFEASVQTLESQSRPDIADEARAVVAHALRASYPARLAEYRETAAQFYAAAFTAPELSRILAFYRTPAGKALTAETDESQARTVAINAAYVLIERKAAGEAFCAAHACPAGDDATSAPPLSLPGGLADPVWSRQPGEWEVGQLRPQLAKTLGLGGLVQMICVVADVGALKNCTVGSEFPAGLGFARAAVGLAGYYQLSGAQVTQGAAGKAVALTIRFPSPVADADGRIEPIEPRSPQSLVLARALVAAQFANREALAAWRRMQDAQPLQADLGYTLADRAAMLDALGKGAEVATAKVADQRAANLTLRLTDEEIVAATAFWRSPAGVAWKTKSSDVGALTQRQGAEFNAQVWRDAGKAICQTRDCDPSAPPQPATAVSSAPSTLRP